MNYQNAESDADDEGGRDGDGGEIEVAKAAGEGLGDDGDGEHGDAAENGRSGELPYFVELEPSSGDQICIFRVGLGLKMQVVRLIRSGRE